jgi:hypothetical protein
MYASHNEQSAHPSYHPAVLELYASGSGITRQVIGVVCSHKDQADTLEPGIGRQPVMLDQVMSRYQVSRWWRSATLYKD